MNTIHVPWELLADPELFFRVSELSVGEFIFSEFKLVIDGLGTNPEYIVDYKKTDKTSITYTYKSDNHKPTKYQFRLTDDVGNGELFVLSPDIDVELEEFIYGGIRQLLFFTRYIMNYPREHKEERISSHRYSYEYRTSTKQNKIYLFSDIVKYVSENYNPAEHHHEMQCPCWEVRGHYRHYKSGKTVFVKSFLKGKNKDTAQPTPKTYTAY